MNENTNEKSVPHENHFLLKVSIGPVQEFIIEARKTKDLYVGSRLLSLATFNSMLPLIEDSDCAIIYPDQKMFDQKKSNISLSNVYMATIPENKLEKITKEMEQSLVTFWEEAASKVYDRISSFDPTKDLWNITIEGKSAKEIWDNQIKNHFYINWVAIPIKKDEFKKLYKSKMQEIQRFFDERKLTRTFEAWDGFCGKKCIQCGHRESLPDEFLNNVGLLEQNLLKKNESLCAVCLIKRLLMKEDVEGLDGIKFESVVEISSGLFRQLVDANQKQDDIDNYFKAIKDLNNLLKTNKIKEDKAEWLYTDYWNLNYLKNNFDFPVGFFNKTKEEQIQSHFEKIQKSLVKIYTNMETKPSKYYTIVNMDGDDMGKLISGAKINHNISPDYQRKLSGILAKISSKTKNIIEYETRRCGYTVYSGGDDLLAFLPLHNSMGAINKARLVFSKSFSENNIKNQTSSAGIVIQHHHDVLRRGLLDSRDNVEKAKEAFYDKDAFFITLKVYSGNIITWFSKWEIKDLEIKKGNCTIKINIQVLDFLEHFISLMTVGKKNRLSPDFLRNILEELPVFYERVNNKLYFNDEMFKLEFDRLLKRHNPKDSDILDNEYMLGFSTIDIMKEFFVYMAKPVKKQDIKDEQINNLKDNFESFLKISLFLIREQTGGFD